MVNDLQELSMNGMRGLHTLDLSKNIITSLRRRAFVGLTKLRYLYLIGNRITYSDPHVFYVLPYQTHIHTSVNPLCCFVVDKQKCVSSPALKASKCSSLLAALPQIPLVIMGLIITCVNILCVCSYLHRAYYIKAKVSMTHMYLHAFDSLVGISILILYGHDQKMGEQFIFSEVSWAQSATCKLIGFLFVFGLKSAMATRVVISLERFIIIYFPFDAELHLKKVLYLSFFVWGIALIMALLHIMIIVPRGNICLYLIERPPFSKAMAVTGTQSVMDVLYVIMILTITTFLLHLSQKSRIASGRAVSRNDYKLYVRSVLHMSNSVVAWLTPVIYVVAILPESYIPLLLMRDIISLFIVPVSTVIDPLVYSLSTKEFWPVVSCTKS